MKSILNIDLINDYIKKNNLTNAGFCKLCNISEETFKLILNDNTDIDLTDLFRISRILGVRICEMFNPK